MDPSTYTVFARGPHRSNFRFSHWLFYRLLPANRGTVLRQQYFTDEHWILSEHKEAQQALSRLLLLATASRERIASTYFYDYERPAARQLTSSVPTGQFRSIGCPHQASMVST